MAQRKTVVTADAVVQAQKGYYYGYIVTAAMSANVSTIYDNATAASGTVIGVVAASAAVGTTQLFPNPVPIANGIYVDIGGTGTILVLHD